MNRTKIVVLALFALFAGVAMAEGNSAAPGQQKKESKSVAEQRAAWEAKFKKADTDGDGALNKAELTKAGPNAFPTINKSFDTMDTNKDGKVTVAERDAFVDAQKSAKKADKAAAKK
jgi:Ca2+-binding EF-hand superfamily protein